MRNLLAKIRALFARDGKEKTTLQKQARLIVIFVGVVLVGLIVYLAAIRPLTHVGKEPVALLPGEERSASGGILLVPYTPRQEMVSIDVHRPTEDFSLIAREAENGDVTFYLKDNAHIALNSQMVAQAVVGGGMVYATSVNSIPRVNENATEEDLVGYGLSADSETRSSFCVNRKDGTSYRIFIGDLIPSGNAYYAMVEGRETVVYALSSSSVYPYVSDSSVLVDTTVTTYLGTTISAVADYTLFRATKDGAEREKIISVKSSSDESSTRAYEMVYPDMYYLNEDRFDASVMDNLIYVTAAEILSYGAKTSDPAVYEKYGLDLDIDRLSSGKDGNYALLYYACVVPDKTTGESTVIENMLYFSRSYMGTDGGTYYNVYSPMMDVIAKIDASVFAFVDWSLASYTSTRMFYDYIGTCDYFELRDLTAGTGVRYTLSGTEDTFHVDVTEAGETGKTVTGSDGKPLVFDVQTDARNEKTGPFENFRQLYLVLITREFDLTKSLTGFELSKSPVKQVSVSTTPRDLAASYGLYDASGERLRDSKGNQIYVRYPGCYLVCQDAVAKAKNSDTTATYPTLYYDASVGRFFQKKIDSDDGELKPVGMGYDKNRNVTIERYIAASYTVEATYEQTISTYDFYAVYDTYTDADGNEKRVINQTYTVVIPTITTITYKVSTETGITEVSRESHSAEVGTVMRKSAVDRLFRDSASVLAGIEIDGYDAD